MLPAIEGELIVRRAIPLVKIMFSFYLSIIPNGIAMELEAYSSKDVIIYAPNIIRFLPIAEETILFSLSK